LPVFKTGAINHSATLPTILKTGAFNRSVTSQFRSNQSLGGDFTRQNPLCPAAKALKGQHLPLYSLLPKA
jgi:hypothetical protein